MILVAKNAVNLEYVRLNVCRNKNIQNGHKNVRVFRDLGVAGKLNIIFLLPHYKHVLAHLLYCKCAQRNNSPRLVCVFVLWNTVNRTRP